MDEDSCMLVHANTHARTRARTHTVMLRHTRLRAVTLTPLI